MAIEDFGMMDPAGVASRIAFEYDGDKKKIARAVQNGILPADAAMMAGMFIDRTIMSNMKPPTTTAFEDVMGTGQADQMGQMAMAPAGMDGAPDMGGGMGVADLPVPDEMMPGYAGGGIVAFAGPEGSLVEEDPLLKDLERLYEFRKTRRESLPSEQREAMRTYYGGASERAQKQAERDKYMTLLEFASALGSSKSPRFTQALAEAGGKVAPSMREAEKARRAIEESGMKGLFDLEASERAEMLKDFEGAESIAARRAGTSNARERVSAYVAAQQELIKAGKRPAASIAQLTNEGWTKQAEEAGMAGPRAETQAYTAQIAAGTYASKERERNKRIYDRARIPITENTDPKQAERIRAAQEEVRKIEADISRVTGILGGGQSAPAGGGGGTSGWGELRVR